MKICKEVVKHLRRVAHTRRRMVGGQVVKMRNPQYLTHTLVILYKKQRIFQTAWKPRFTPLMKNFLISFALDKKFPVQKAFEHFHQQVYVCVCVRSSKLRHKICRLSNRTFSFLLSPSLFVSRERVSAWIRVYCPACTCPYVETLWQRVRVVEPPNQLRSFVSAKSPAFTSSFTRRNLRVGAI